MAHSFAPITPRVRPRDEGDDTSRNENSIMWRTLGRAGPHPSEATSASISPSSAARAAPRSLASWSGAPLPACATPPSRPRPPPQAQTLLKCRRHAAQRTGARRSRSVPNRAPDAPSSHRADGLRRTRAHSPNTTSPPRSPGARATPAARRDRTRSKQRPQATEDSR